MQVLAQKYNIGFYNVENLFDTINDPKINDEDFLPGGKNTWTQERYKQKLINLNQAIDEMGNLLFLGMCEIENKQVVKDLINNSDKRRKKFAISHIDSPDARGIDVALIYDSTKATLMYKHNIRFTLPGKKEPSTRDILVSKFLVKKDTIHILVNHWPSRTGGQEKSDENRVEAAKNARLYIDSVLAVNPQAKIVLMGDLNDYPDNNAPQAIAQKLTPMITPQSGIYGGSYNYRGEWGILDHIFVSPTFIEAKKRSKVIENSGAIISSEFLLEKYKDAMSPKRTYGGKEYTGGYSDHLPVTISIKVKSCCFF